MLVSEFMTRGAISVRPDTTLAEAVRILAARRIKRLTVVRGNTLVGILNDSDVLRACPANLNPFSPVAADDPALKRPVSRAMTSPAQTIDSDAPLEEAARIFIDRKIGALPVMSGKSLVGIITETDAFRALITLLGEGPGIRITFDVPREEEDVLEFVLELSRRHGMRVGAVLSREHGDRRLVVVRLLGREDTRLMEDIWRTGHRVISVARFPG